MCKIFEHLQNSLWDPDPGNLFFNLNLSTVSNPEEVNRVAQMV